MTPQQWSRAFTWIQTLSSRSTAEARVALTHSSEDPDVIEEVLQTLQGLDEPDPPSLSFGTRLGKYEVGEKLGEGSYGAVYRGRDTVLGRDVALKFLAPTTLLPKSAARSLVEEAQAASALNHPNIITVHEVLTTETGPVIVMELVEGRSLREFLPGPVPAARARQYAVQLLEALAVAHAKGIVHRDVKPENVMVRPDGYLKVLDFGLARQIENNTGGEPLWGTGPAGTLRYMSPEQCRGEAAAAASDVFSAGLVLYEMATGQHPFAAPTPLETANSILRVTPRPRGKSTLMAVAMRMLAKEAKQRPGAAQALELLRASERRGRTQKLVVVSAVALLSMLCVALFWKRDAAPLSLVNPVALTANLGHEDSPDISPDGQSVVYSDHAEIYETARLMIKRSDQSAPVKLLEPASGEELEKPVWSPDGRRVLYRSRTAQGKASLWTIAPDGRDKRKLIDLVSSGLRSMLDWSPDGRQIVYPDWDRDGDRKSSIHILDLATGQQSVITHPPPASGGDLDPKFSPDGSRIVFKRRLTGALENLLLVPAQGGATRQLTDGLQRSAGHAWLSDGRSLIVSRSVGGGAFALWRLRLDSPGAPEPLLEGTENFLLPAIRGRRVAWLNGTDANAIFRIPITGGEPVFVTGSASLDTDPSIAPDGRIAFMSRRSGNEEIWIAEADGANAVRVTNLGKALAGLEWSPDGRQLLFSSESNAAGMIMDCELGKPLCGQPRRVTPNGVTSSYAAWSSDGSSIYFNSLDDHRQVFRMPAAGGDATQITHGDSSLAAKPSPDGKWLYFSRSGAIWRLRLESGVYQEELIVGPPYRLRTGDYALAGDEVIFWDLPDANHASAIRALNTRTRRMRTILETPHAYSPAVSRDGRMLLYAGTDRRRGHIIIMMAKLNR